MSGEKRVYIPSEAIAFCRMGGDVFMDYSSHCRNDTRISTVKHKGHIRGWYLGRRNFTVSTALSTHSSSIGNDSRSTFSMGAVVPRSSNRSSEIRFFVLLGLNRQLEEEHVPATFMD
jgi:hypothetical protein